MAKFSTNQDEILIEEIQKYSAIYDYESDNYKNFLVKENAWKKISFSVKKDVDDCKKRWKSIKDTYFRHRRKLQMGTGSSALDKPVKWNLYQRLSFLDKVKHERSSKHTLDFDESQMTEIESEPVEASESTLDFDDTDPDEISNPSTSRVVEHAKAHKLNPHISQSDTTSTTTASRCSSAASSSTTVSKQNMKRCRNNDSKDAYLKRFEERAQKRTEILQAIHDRKETPELDETDLFMKSISLTVKKLPKPLINEAKLGILTLVANLEARAMSSNTHQANRYNLNANNSLGDYFQSYNPQPQQPLTQIPNSQLSTAIESTNIDDITFQQL